MSNANEFRPNLGVIACTAIVVGNMVGSGFYLSPSALAPYGMLAILAWVVMGGGAICLGLTFARLARLVSAESLSNVSRRRRGSISNLPDEVHVALYPIGANQGIHAQLQLVGEPPGIKLAERSCPHGATAPRSKRADRRVERRREIAERSTDPCETRHWHVALRARRDPGKVRAFRQEP